MSEEVPRHVVVFEIEVTGTVEVLVEGAGGVEYLVGEARLTAETLVQQLLHTTQGAQCGPASTPGLHGEKIQKSARFKDTGGRATELVFRQVTRLREGESDFPSDDDD